MFARAIRFLLLALVVVPGVAFPVNRVSAGQAVQPRPVETPSRDNPAQRSDRDTASISGRVVSLDTGAPIKGARVSVTAGLSGGARTATTDSAGRYIISGLPGGSVTVGASRAPFLPTSYKQRSWPGIGTAVSVQAGQRVDGIDLALPRGGVVTGRVFAEDGEPLLGATVRVGRVEWINGERRIVPGASDSTDDRGEYRVYGLRPGTYYVSATAGQDATAAPPQRAPGSVGYAPTYHPSTANIAEAVAVRVDVSRESGGIDISALEVAVADVSGSVSGLDGSGVASVVLLPEGNNSAMAAPLQSPVARDRTFRIRGVPPGRYVAFVRDGLPGRSRPVLFAVQPISVDGQDLLGLTLALRRGGTINGRMVFDGATLEPPDDLGSFRLMALGLRASHSIAPSAAAVNPDGTFVISNVPPLPVILDAAIPRASPARGPEAAAWFLQQISVQGRDITDNRLQVEPEGEVSGVTVVFTDRPSGFAGTVDDGVGRRVAGCTVVAFPEDPAMWASPGARRFGTARTDSEGRFDIRPLPPGRYHVAALADVDPLEWSDPVVLGHLREGSFSAVVGENRTTDIELHLKRR